MKLLRKEKKVLFGSTVLYTLLHMLSVGRWNFWHDESFSAMTIDYGWAEMIERTARDVHPPLYYVFLKPWAQIFGDGDIALRMMSVVFSVFSFVLAYLLVRRLFSAKAAMSAALIMMIGPFLVRYGIEARMYPLAATLLLVNAHAFLSLVRGQRQKLAIIVYIFSLAAALYTQYYSGLILVGQGLYLLYVGGAFKPKSWWKPNHLFSSVTSIGAKWWLSWAAIIALFVPWIPKVLDQVNTIQGAFWIREISHESFYSSLTSMLFFNESYTLVGYEALFGLLAVIALIVLVVTTFRREKTKRKELVFMSGYFVVPAAVLFTMSLILQPTYFDRYFALFATMFYSLIGVCLYYAYSKKYWNRLSLFALSALLVGSLLVGNKIIIQRGDFDGDKSVYQMKSLMHYVDKNYSLEDNILVDGLGADYFDAWFYNTTDSVVQIYGPDGFTGYGNHTLVYERDDLIVEDMEQEYEYGETVWFVSSSDSDNGHVPSDWYETGNNLKLGRGQVTKYVVR